MSQQSVFLLGLGSVRLSVVERLVRQGRAPAFARLLLEGASAPELINLYPNKSHAAWISAASGATAGTHGVVSILTTDTGGPPYRQELLGSVRRAEYLWEAAERQGKQAIVLNWPDSWPSRLRKGIQIGGASLGVNATFFQGAVEAYQGPVHRFALGADELFSTDPAEGYSPLKMAPLEQSGARPSGVRSGLAARLELRCKDSDRELARTPALWLVAPCEGGPVSIYEDGRWDRPIGAIAPRQWSERIDLRVDTADGPVPCALRMKLLSLDAAAGRARLYVTPVCAIRDGRTAPAGAAPELDGLKTFPIPTPTFLGPYCAQRLDPDSQRELLAMNGDWHLDALRLLLRRPFDLFVFHTNEVDWAEHAVHAHYRAGVDRGTCERMIEGVYEDLDRLVGGIVDALPPGTTLLAMSQHGVVDPWQVRPGLDVALALERAGLLFRTGAGAIDYETSIAFPSAEKGFVNVRPWKPRTAGERAERKKNVRAALRALSAAVLPVSGERAFPVALPWEQAAPFGIHGPRQADILVLRPAEYGGIHGPCYPLAAGGESSLKGMFLFSGTGVRTGFREERPVWPEDLAPTAAQLLGIKPPAQSEGRVLHSMLR